MRKARRALTATAAVVAGGLVLAGCTSGGDGDNGGQGSGGDNTVHILVLKHPLTGAMADMDWVSQIEEMADVEIVWEEVSADWDQKKSTMLAAGDIPDLVVGVNAITGSDLVTFNGLFEDLSDDLDALPNVQGMFEAVPQTEAMATQPDGAVYSLPSYRRFWPETATRQYINQQWLDNLGLAMPTTWDELLDVLRAFKDEDANGNGDPNDEIPMDWAPTGTGGFGFFQPSVFLGSLGLPITGGGGAGYFVEDGQVGNFFTDERYRDVVEFLHEAYAEGLISQEVMTQDYSAYQSIGRGNGDDATVGFSWGWTASDRFGAQLEPQYAATAPMLAPGTDASEVVWTYDTYSLNYGPNSITMSAQTDVRDAALRVIDAFYDQTISVQVLWGDIGPNITEAGEGSYEVLAPADEASDPSTWKWTTTLADNGPMWIRDDIDVVLPTDLQESVDEALPLADALANVDPVADVFPAEFFSLSAEDSSTITLNNTTFLSIAMQNWATWVTEGGADSGWDDHVAQLEAAGLPQNVEIYQSYYDDYVASLG
ncbi:extracellular solute-binding protein [Occultella kanbiaonis]|uniref:extracellular solute-binding protein n=1 Tax=Occultella kanbiaonis TaxID=2675754 RepID=UPI0013D3A5EA|nr:extracellular solute-binding protein [Occultella kanbiaonis]